MQQAAQKGIMAFEALSRITSSTWGPSTKQSRLLYTAVVRPTMLYGSQVWGLQDDRAPPAASLIKPLKCLQNRCLRKVMEAYKRTLTAALERESNVQPLDLYMEHKAMQGSLKTADNSVFARIRQVANTVWTAVRAPAGGMPGRRRHGTASTIRPLTTAEGLQQRVTARTGAEAAPGTTKETAGEPTESTDQVDKPGVETKVDPQVSKAKSNHMEVRLGSVSSPALQRPPQARSNSTVSAPHRGAGPQCLAGLRGSPRGRQAMFMWLASANRAACASLLPEPHRLPRPLLSENWNRGPLRSSFHSSQRSPGGPMAGRKRPTQPSQPCAADHPGGHLRI